MICPKVIVIIYRDQICYVREIYTVLCVDHKNGDIFTKAVTAKPQQTTRVCNKVQKTDNHAHIS